MDNASNEEIKAEHRLWALEHTNWRKEVREWDKEIVQAIKDLKDIELMLKEHESALDAHVDRIKQHERIELEHDESLHMGDVYSGSEQSADPMHSVHVTQSNSHDLQRDAHERMRRHHLILMSRWDSFLKALRSAM